MITKPNNRERNNTIDVARGIAMLLVILGHSFYSLDTPLNLMITSFHMPLFFFLSGLVAKDNIITVKQLRNNIYNKTKTYMIPQVTLGVITIVYNILFLVILKHKSFAEIDYFYCFWRWWFLEVTLEVVILFKFLSYFTNLDNLKVKIYIMFFLLVTIAIIIHYRDKAPNESVGYLNVLPVGFLFYYLGFLYKNKIKEYRFTSFVNGISLVISLPLLFFLSNTNTHVTMYNNHYGNIFLFLICVALGIYSVLCLAANFRKSRFFLYVGINSIVFTSVS